MFYNSGNGGTWSCITIAISFKHWQRSFEIKAVLLIDKKHVTALSRSSNSTVIIRLRTAKVHKRLTMSPKSLKRCKAPMNIYEMHLDPKHDNYQDEDLNYPLLNL